MKKEKNMPQKKHKIIHVITTLGYGGAERLVLDLMRHRDKENFDYEVISMVRGGGLEKDIKDTGVALTIFYKKNKLGLGVFFKLYSYFKKAKPDIVHTHLFGADVWAGLAAKIAGVAVIIKTEHNVNLDEGGIKKMVKKISSNVFKKIVAVSPSVKEHMIMEEGMAKDRITIIYNGIDLARFKSKEKQVFSSPPILINVSRFETQKAHEYLIRAFKKIENRQWILWLVGEGSLKPEIEQMVKDMGLSDKVKFMGLRHDVPNVLAQADIFVFPSLWEGLGIAALEAGAVGLPIVATKVEGIKDLFQDNKNALLVEAKDEGALAEAISWMLEHPDKAMFLGRQAQNLVKENYGIKTMVEKYEKMYKSFLE